MENIKTVDLAPILTGEEPGVEELRKVSQEFSQSLKTIGFVYLINHGIEDEVIEQAMEASKEYFKLDEAIKKEDTIGHGPEFQGWVAQGREVFDQDEGQTNWSKLQK